MNPDPYKYFRLEARELLDRLHAGVLELDRSLGSYLGTAGTSPGGGDIVRNLLRAAHTLKGAARAVRQREIAEHSHAIEDALEPFRDAGGVTRAAIEAILPRLDDMELWVRALGRPPEPAPPPGAAAPTGGPRERVAGGTPGSGPSGVPVIATAVPVIATAAPKGSPAPWGSQPPAPASPSSAASPPASPQAASPPSASPPSSGSRTDSGALPALALDDATRALRAEIGDMDSVLDGVAEAHTALRALRRLAGDIEAAHRLAGVVSEQVSPRSAVQPAEAHATAAQLTAALGAIERGADAAIERLDRELRGVHAAAEQLRLVPARALFTTLERAARDAGRAMGCAIAFEHRGGDVRLDAHVLNGVQPALLQLVRNAVAHGIEPPAERERIGKPRAGRIAIEVERRNRRIAFRCRDDGRGLDVAVVREVAIRRGVLSPATGALTAGQIVELLMRGGISTAETVTAISGRGIGLDVVREAAVQLGGTVRVDSAPGAGTRFELEVPVSLAAIAALAVEDNGAIATIPLPAVRRVLRIAARDIVATPAGAAIVHDGKVIPFLPLATALGRGGATARDDGWSAVIVEDDGRLVALGVSHVVGTATVVVRPLPELAPCDPVIGGAALDADGDPQLVLDPAGLVAARPRQLTAVDRRRPRILVVDDSVTTRMLEQSILESAGYQVDLAVSGEDALIRARTTDYALFLVDVEMPGMDGFSFIEHLQHDASLRKTPAILVTSRASPADRARGRAVGAQGYMDKGAFDQGELLEQIARLVA